MDANLNLKIDSTQATSAEAALKKLELAGKRSDAQFKSLSNSSKGANLALGKIAATVGALVSTGGFVKLSNQVAQFEQSLLKLRAISGATEKQMAALQKQSRDLGATSIFSAKQAADAQTFLAQAGFRVNEVLKATPGILRLAQAGSLDLARAADIASNVLGGMRLNVSELNRVNDVLAKTAASSNTSIEQLGASLSYAAPIAASAGVSIEEVSAIIGKLGDSGLQGSRAGTAVVGFIRQLSNATPAAQESLAKYGLTMADVSIETNGVADVLKTLRDANISTADSFKIFGSEVAPAVSILTSSANGVDELSESLRDAQGAADEMAKVMGGGLTNAQRQLSSALQEANLSINEYFAINESLEKLLVNVADQVNNFSTALKDGEFDAHIETIKQISTAVAITVSAYAALRAVIMAAAAAQLVYNAMAAKTPVQKAAIIAGGLLGSAAVYKIYTDAVREAEKAQQALNDSLAPTEGLVIEISGGVQEAATSLYSAAAATGNYWMMLNEQVEGFAQDNLSLIDQAKQQIESYGDTWTRTGNQALDAMGSMIASLAKVTAAEKKNDALRAEMQEAGLEGTDEYIQLEKQKIDMSIKGSADIMSAASAMFKEGSREQQIAHKASLALHAITMAARLKEAVAAATVAVAEQGKGDPYTAFARVAAMGAMMVGVLSNIGASFGLSGGGGGSSLPLNGVQASAGGRFDGQQSESVSNITESLLDLEVDQYRELRGINDGVKNLTDAMTGTVRGLFMGGDIAAMSGAAINQFTPSSLGGAIDSLVGSIPLIGGALGGIGSAIFGSTTTKTKDYGLMASGTIDSLMVQGFADIEKKSKNLFGTRKSTSTQTTGISDEATNSLNLVFASLADTMIAVGEQLDRDIQSELSSFQFNLGKISLQGSPAEVTERLQNAISTQGDRLANAMFADIVGAYQRVDEGIFETATRVAIERGMTQNVLEMTGQRLVGDAVAISQSLVQIAGGMKELRDAAEEYYDKFFSDAEKATRNQENLAATLADINFVLPSTRDGFRRLVESLDMTTEHGRTAYVTLVEAAKAADDYYKTIETGVNELRDSVAKAWDAFSSQYDKIRSGLIQLLGSEAVLANERAKTLRATDPLLKAQQKQLWLLQDVAKAQETYNNGIQEARGFLDSSFRTIRNFTAGLMMTSAAATSAAFAAQTDAARGGDRAALSGITSTAQTFLTQSRAGSSTLEEYLRIQSGVMLDLLELEEELTPEQFLASEIRDAIEQQTESLIGSYVSSDSGLIDKLSSTLSVSDEDALTYSQITTALAGKATDSEIRELIAKTDTNNDGLISAIELNAVKDQSLATAIGRSLQPMFNMIDTSLDGVIDYEEFKKTFEGLADDETLGMVYDALAGSSGVIEKVAGVEETTDPLALAAQFQLEALDSIWDNTAMQVDAMGLLNNTMLDLTTALRQLHGLELAQKTQSAIEEKENIIGGLTSQQSAVVRARATAEETAQSRIGAVGSAYSSMIANASKAYKSSSNRKKADAATASARNTLVSVVNSMREQLADPQTAKSTYQFLSDLQKQTQAKYNWASTVRYKASHNRRMADRVEWATRDALNSINSALAYGKEVGAPSANPSSSSYNMQLNSLAQQISNEQAQLQALMEELKRNEDLAATGVDGSHRSGLNYVPFDGYRAELHQGEMVVPKGQSDFLRMGGIVIELQQLRQEVVQLRQQSARADFELIKSSKDMRDTIDQWNFDGLPAERT